MHYAPLMLAIDFANAEPGQLDSPERAAAWLGAHGVRADLTELDMRTLVSLHAAAAAVMRAAAGASQPPQGTVDVINAASAGAAVAPQLNWPAGGRPRMWLSTPASSGGHALGTIARSVIDLLTGPGRSRLRICEAHGCDRLYAAASRRRRWCSQGCGNRVRVARHAAKARGARD